MSGTSVNALTAILPGLADPTQGMKSPVEYASQYTTARRNALELQKQQAEKIAGELALQSIDPKTGKFSQDIYNQKLATTPGAAQAAFSTMQDASKLTTDRLAQAKAQLSTISQYAPDLINNPSDGNVKEIFRKLTASGAMTQEQADAEMQTVLAMPAQQRQLYGLQHGKGALDALQRLHANTGGEPVQLDTGGGIQGGKVDPISGAITPAGQPVTKTLSPGEQTEKYEWKTPDGIVHQGTRTQYIAATGQEPPGGGQQVPGQGTIPANPNAPTGTQPGRYAPANPALRNPAVATPAPAPAAPTPATPAPTQPAQPAVPGAPIAQPAPGMDAKWKASSDQYAAASADSGNYQARMQPLVSSRAILESSPDLTTGQGAEAVNRIKSGLQTLITTLTPADVQTIRQAKFDELGKYFQQAVNANPFAGASDARLASAIGGSPNLHMSTLANKEVLKGLIGLERMKQMAFTEFQTSGKPPSQFSDFMTDWQSSHDPRAFVMDMLDGSHREKVLASLKSPAERTAFQNSLNLVKANSGLMTQAPMTQ